MTSSGIPSLQRLLWQNGHFQFERNAHTADFLGGVRMGVVVSQFNSDITDVLLSGAIEALQQAGVLSPIDVVRVPGAFELPLACKTLASLKDDRHHQKYHALVALGCVIRGDTTHYDYVCQGVTSGIQQVMLETNTPVAFGVITTENHQQALDRAGGVHGNKGAEAAWSALVMASIQAGVHGPAPYHAELLKHGEHPQYL
jgi:6,7-dimethyl-8-ribityllumazine synthase